MNTTNLRSGAPVPFKRLARPSLGKMLQPEASGTANIQVPYLKAGHVQWHGVDLPEDLPLMWASHSDVKDLTPAPGDLLICEGGEVGRAALAPDGLPENTIIQNSLHLVRETDSACPRYLKYALEHVAASGWIDLICNKATIAHLTVDKLRELPIPFWNKQDQRRIANFLDEKTERIDALIAEKEQLGGRLREYRLSLISAAVTKTDKTDAQRVDTRPPPLKVGALVPFKRLAKPSLGKMLQPVASTTANLQVPYLKAGHVQWHGVDLPTELPLMWASATDVKGLSPAPGDLLICEGGEVGRAALAPPTLPKNTIIQNSLHLVRESSNTCPRYLKYALEHIASTGWIDLVCNKATIAHLTVDKLRELPIPYRDKAGQELIANLLDEQTARIEVLQNHVNEHVERLREYRSSLISAAVTGCIKIED